MDQDETIVNQNARDMMKCAKHVSSRSVVKHTMRKDDTLFTVDERIIYLKGSMGSMRLYPDENKIYVVGRNGYDTLYEMDAETAQQAKKFLLSAHRLVKYENLRASLRSFSYEILVATFITGAIAVYWAIDGKGKGQHPKAQKLRLNDTINALDSVKKQNATMYWFDSQKVK